MFDMTISPQYPNYLILSIKSWKIMWEISINVKVEHGKINVFA